MLFISYARPNESAVVALHADLEHAGHQTWFDRELPGGQSWWENILTAIRDCSLFVFALSPDSLRSPACLAELEYAEALGKPVLPVKLSEVDLQLAPDSLQATQYVDYRSRSKDQALKLASAAAAEGAATADALPNPLPAPPTAPVSDLGGLREQIATPHLPLDSQLDLVHHLEQRVGEVDLHGSLVGLAQMFLDRDDVTVASKRRLDALLAELPVATAEDDPTLELQRRRPLAELERDSVDLLQSMVSHVEDRQLTPVLGRGMTNSLIGPIGRLSRELARSFDSPTALRRRSDLPLAAQFVEVMTGTAALRSSINKYVRTVLADRHGDAGASADLGSLLAAAWRSRREAATAEPHMVMADLRCPIYVTTNPWDLLERALSERDEVEPEVEMCRWRPDVYDWPESVFDREPDYVPSPERPLVFHVFGTATFTDSLVLSTDDYLDFLVAVTRDRDLVPPPVRTALADSALLLLGFGLDEIDVRVLLRALVSQEGGRRRGKRYRHVGAQTSTRRPTDGSDQSREQTYLQRYFGDHLDPRIDIFWGTVEEFALGLWELRGDNT